MALVVETSRRSISWIPFWGRRVSVNEPGPKEPLWCGRTQLSAPSTARTDQRISRAMMDPDVSFSTSKCCSELNRSPTKGAALFPYHSETQPPALRRSNASMTKILSSTYDSELEDSCIVLYPAIDSVALALTRGDSLASLGELRMIDALKKAEPCITHLKLRGL